jgi:DNA repair ATPase RecN|nr:MAG TPA: Rad50 ABC-ATPase, Mre11, DNA double-strand break [Caudoviricetes sp.]
MLLLKVENYRSIKDAKVTVNGLTILKGESNAGKSSFIKAYFASVTNRFTTGCVRFGEKEANIYVKYGDCDEKLKVTRREGSSPLTMKFGTKEKGYETFEKLGTDIPEVLQKFHNFSTIKSGSDKFFLNFTTQYSPPLLMRFSTKRVVEILSYSKTLNQAQKVQKYLSDKNSELKVQFKSFDTILSEQKDKIHKVGSFLDTAFKDYDKINALNVELCKNKENLESVKELLTCLNRQIFLQKQASQISKINEKIEEIGIYNISKYKELYVSLEKKSKLESSSLLLSNILSELTSVKSSIHAKECYLTLSNSLENSHTLKKSVSLLSDLIGKITIIQETNHVKERYLTLSNSLEKHSILKKSVSLLGTLVGNITTIQETNKKIKSVNYIIGAFNRGRELKNDIKDLNIHLDSSVCPFCGNKLNN